MVIHRRLPDGRDLMDREALAQWLSISVRSLPLDGAFVRVDAKTEQRLYDAEAVARALRVRRDAAATARRRPRVRALRELATRRPEGS